MIKKGSKLLDLLSDEEKVLYLNEKKAKKLEQSNGQKVFRRFARMVSELGFIRKSNWFSKEQEYIANVIHFHKYTYGPEFRMHVLIRVLNDSCDHIVLLGLEGMEFDAYEKYFEYGESEESILKCATYMFEALEKVAIPWFESNTIEILLRPTSRITDSGRKGLLEALNENTNPKYVQHSRKILGLSA